MSIQIELKPEIEAELKALARKKGVPVNKYVQGILEQFAPTHLAETSMTREDRAKAFQDWVANFPYRRNKPLSDDAISRESLYRRDDR
jgi:hypothetical protein